MKEDAGKGLAFDKIGNFYGGRWMKDDIEVVFADWYDGQYVDGSDLLIYADADTANIASILRLTREPVVTIDELNAYTSAGTVPEGKTKEDMEKAQNQLGTLIFAAAFLN